MAEFSYAKGRINESLRYIASEIKEFESDYSARSWQDYQNDAKLQKLMDRTVENILTALIEICGTIAAEKGIAAENYSEVLLKAAQLFGFSENEQRELAKLAAQRNRLAHRYLDLKWQAIKMFNDHKKLVHKLLEKILSSENK
ncbi:MAG: DUF86 domain-containing protein [Nitrospirae bacterium]|nr:DUF86 domain-containing protein [Nitrospirota bacterium]